MLIAIDTEVLPEPFHWTEMFPVRGTEKFYVETAKALRKAGHEVDLFKEPNRKRSDITYDVVLRCNPRDSRRRIRGHREIDWTNFYFSEPKHYETCGFGDEVVVISQFARGLLPKPRRNRAKVVPHGYDPTVYFPSESGQRKRQVAFTSSPDRGLAYLSRIWEDNDIEAATGYRLWTGKYGQTKISDVEVANNLRESDFWVHPGQGIELFCLSAVEAQACGCTPIVVPNGGLQETVNYGYRFTTSSFAEGLVAVLSGEATLRDVTAKHIPTWDVATAMLLDG